MMSVDDNHSNTITIDCDDDDDDDQPVMIVDCDEYDHEDHDNELLEPITEVPFTEHHLNRTEQNEKEQHSDQLKNSLPDSTAKMLDLQRVKRQPQDTPTTETSSSNVIPKPPPLVSAPKMNSILIESDEGVVNLSSTLKDNNLSIDSNIEVGNEQADTPIKNRGRPRIYPPKIPVTIIRKRGRPRRGEDDNDKSMAEMLALGQHSIFGGDYDEKKESPHKDNSKTTTAFNSSKSNGIGQDAVGNIVFQSPDITLTEIGKRNLDNISLSQQPADTITTQNSGIVTNLDGTIRKKRGRKPGSKYPRLNKSLPSKLDNQTNTQSLDSNELIAPIEDMLQVVQYDEQVNDTSQHDQLSELVNKVDGVVGNKRRGRPKADLSESNLVATSHFERNKASPTVNTMASPNDQLEIMAFPKRRGRKPKSWYEQQLKQDQPEIPRERRLSTLSRQSYAELSDENSQQQKHQTTISDEIDDVAKQNGWGAEKRKRRKKMFFDQNYDMYGKKRVHDTHGSEQNDDIERIDPEDFEGFTSTEAHPDDIEVEQQHISESGEIQIPKRRGPKPKFLQPKIPMLRYRKDGTPKIKPGPKPRNFLANGINSEHYSAMASINEKYRLMRQNKFGRQFKSDNDSNNYQNEQCSAEENEEDVMDTQEQDAIQQQNSDMLDPSTNDVDDTIKMGYLENYNKVLKDRNNSLLDVLEQRQVEIRELKLRVSNLSKDNQDGNMEKDSILEDGSPNTNGTSNKWSNSELLKAYSLQQLNSKLYSYFQRRFTLPLPSQNEIDRFIQNVQFGQGMQSNVIQILDFNGESMEPHERVAVLHVNEIETKSLYEYDIDGDFVYGPHSFISVIVAQGLYSPWRQCVYMKCDQKINKDILMDVVEQLNNIDYNVSACVTRCNQGKKRNERVDDPAGELFKELGVTLENNYFMNQYSGQYIYAFYYIEELLIEMRRQFLTKGFILDDYRIDKAPLMLLFEQQRKFDQCHTITTGLISPTIDARIIDQNSHNLDLALKLFSRQCVNSLRAQQIGDRETNLATAKFIELIHNYSALMHIRDDIEIGFEVAPYGQHIFDQNNFLNDVQLSFYKLRINGQSDHIKYSRFQQAIMISVDSLKHLQHISKQRYQRSIVSTYRIGRNHLTTSLSELSTEKLTPIQAIRMVKKVYLNETQPLVEETENLDILFCPDPIDASSKTETYYVELLVVWTITKFNIPVSNSCEFSRMLYSFDDVFQTLQNPEFKSPAGVIGKMLNKLKTHTFGVHYNVIKTFVIQRLLLRVAYLNSITKVQPKSEGSN